MVICHTYTHAMQLCSIWPYKYGIARYHGTADAIAHLACISERSSLVVTSTIVIATRYADWWPYTSLYIRVLLHLIDMIAFYNISLDYVYSQYCQVRRLRIGLSDVLSKAWLQWETVREALQPASLLSLTTPPRSYRVCSRKSPLIWECNAIHKRIVMFWSSRLFWNYSRWTSGELIVNSAYKTCCSREGPQSSRSSTWWPWCSPGCRPEWWEKTHFFVFVIFLLFLFTFMFYVYLIVVFLYCAAGGKWGICTHASSGRNSSPASDFGVFLKLTFPCIFFSGGV